MYQLNNVDHYILQTNDSDLKAALELAVKIHKGKVRKKSHRPYLDHLLLVYDILDKFGRSKEQKAIALLHDTVEDSEELEGSIAKLHQYLCEALGVKDCIVKDDDTIKKLSKKEGQGKKGDKNDYDELIEPHLKALNAAHGNQMTAQEQWSLIICNGVGQLTKGAKLFEGKRTYQVKNTSTMSEAIKPIKIIDQAASVIDDIAHATIPNLTGKAKEQKKAQKMALAELYNSLAFARKGYDVARAASNGGDWDNDQYFRLYDRVYSLAKLNYDDALVGDYVAVEKRKTLDIEQLVQEAVNKTLPHSASPPEQGVHIYYPKRKLGDLDQGLQHVTLSMDCQRVLSYGVITDVEKVNSKANRTSNNLLEQIEKVRGVLVGTVTGQSSTKKGAEKGGGITTYTIKRNGKKKEVDIREFDILSSPSDDIATPVNGLNIREFMRAATVARAIDPLFKEKIKDIVKQLTGQELEEDTGYVALVASSRRSRQLGD